MREGFVSYICAIAIRIGPGFEPSRNSSGGRSNERESYDKKVDLPTSSSPTRRIGTTRTSSSIVCGCVWDTMGITQRWLPYAALHPTRYSLLRLGCPAPRDIVLLSLGHPTFIGHKLTPTFLKGDEVVKAG